MSRLVIWEEADTPVESFSTQEFSEIKSKLDALGVTFERWEASAPVAAGSSEEDVLAAYKNDIDTLVARGGYQSMDVVSLTADHPQKDEFRAKYLQEHIHTEDEVRFFVDGSGLFAMHVDDAVYEVTCEKGDLISVPAQTTHWFDMGPNPNFACIRLFNNPEGWVAQYSGSDIAEKYSRHEGAV